MNKEYITRKASVAALNEQITQKGEEIRELKIEISEVEEVVRSASERLKSEEIGHATSSKLSVLKRKMTLNEFRDQKAHLADWRKKLPELNAALENLNQELHFLQTDLVRERTLLIAARSEVMAELVDKELREFTTASGEKFKNLTLAIIAQSGRNKPFSTGQMKSYMDSLYRAICETVMPSVFGADIPDSHEASKIINETLEREIEREAA
ncbi:MAG: hypothetical protein WAW61_11495 [Methylococcaceae bacterium]